MPHESTNAAAGRPLVQCRPSLGGTIAFVVTMVVIYLLGQIPI